MEEQTKGVATFITLLIREFDIPENELLDIWDKYVKAQIPEKKESEFTLVELNKLKKKQLEELCKSKGITHTGTKQVLISRLLGETEVSNSTKTNSSKKSKAPTASDVFRMIKNPSTIHIRRNAFGNYEHMETKLVFDESSKKVIGKQNDDGTLLPLSTTEIELCKKYLFNYDVPYTLRDVYEK